MPADPTGWANRCLWYRDHQAKHRWTPSWWTCDACHPEEGHPALLPRPPPPPDAARQPAKAEGVVRTARHLYYFNGAGPWPGVTSITRVLDAPAHTNWNLGEVARSAVENAERLIEKREAVWIDDRQVARLVR